MRVLADRPTAAQSTALMTVRLSCVGVMKATGLECLSATVPQMTDRSRARKYVEGLALSEVEGLRGLAQKKGAKTTRVRKDGKTERVFKTKKTQEGKK